MSKYKDRLREILKKESIQAERILSIGAQVDDRQYFESVNVTDWVTLDNDPSFNPDLEWNMNRSMRDDESAVDMHEHYKQFDCVLALNLWEYIYDPMTAHKNIGFLLKQGGLYIGSYVFVYGKHNPAGADFLRYTDDGIRKLLTMSGFKQIEIKPIISNDLLTTYYQSEELRIRKDVDHNVAGYIAIARI